MAKRWTVEDEAVAIAMYRADASIDMIAQALDYGRGAISGKMSRLNVNSDHRGLTLEQSVEDTAQYFPAVETALRELLR